MRDPVGTPSSTPAGAGLDVEVAPEPPDWRAFLADRPEATVFHDPAWGVVMREVYGNRPYYLTARAGGRIVGVLSLVCQRSRLFGTRLCSVPYLDSAGVLAEEPAATDALLAAADGLRGELGIPAVEVRQDAPLAGDRPVRTDKVTLVLDLPDSAEALWAGFKPKLRNLVRKPQKAGLVIEAGGSERMGEFHGVYARTMRDLGSPPHGRRFFDRLAEALGESVRLFVVRQGERTLAAGFALTDQGGVHVPWAAADWRCRDTGANMLLYWAMLEDACGRGAAAFDFGRSSRGSGTYHFKTQWGAQERPLYWHYLLAEGAAMPDLRPDSPKYRLFVNLWRRLPVPIARGLGPAIIGRLS